jgi:N-acyl-D-aspartate/D-glutamate deacylase
LIHIRRSCAISAALTITLALCTPVFAKTSAVKYDVIISGGTVFDGSGRAGVASDVAITNGQIVRIGKIDPKSAKNLKLKERGMLKPGFFADVVVFDPATIADKATYAEPMQ